MDQHVLKSPLRENFLVYWMPTVDGFPQKWEWIKDYGTLDGLFSYSHFGKRALEEQSVCRLGKHLKMPELKVNDIVQPGVDTNVFKPLPKSEVKKVFGVPEHAKFVGTVMRNQPRKLFDRIIQSFSMFKKDYPKESENVFLLLHTSIPDVGWNIPECVARAGIGEHTCFTYICRACNASAISSRIVTGKQV